MILRSRKEFDDVEELQITDGNSEEERIARSELEAQLWKLIDELPEKRRDIFLMAKRDGLSYKEIAEETGLTVKTIENHISRALKSLRKKNRTLYLYFFL